ncbi:hypothetical protein [Hoeflea olei]|uniref:DUF680 domain-containing protein n=1 Tax=Hoeflea olei TaxID=1480615 RepID=A0A1C1Z0W7_9HYPH|nr:hypothetical protein [Hoeflea olei]OCW59413.1 hypothetical protein AWJ14_10310 [Hoeflea olei]
MNKIAFAAALSLASVLSFATTSAFAETVEAPQAKLCIKAPEKAAKAGIDCTATSVIATDKAKGAKQYPSGPTNFGSGLVF